ncbi:hypothetical protein B0I35DRAFT_473763 [Stachybotrys elegans]|uniref:Uncharacterized protein n=1 Tax=Stachybotrys elegans TaxID=80388 RepID=A0A8K0T282_9HYPO|nr:hypothetical protein B0I35DRAFT_473763 [Stachybotrys elegans]
MLSANAPVGRVQPPRIARPTTLAISSLKRQLATTTTRRTMLSPGNPYSKNGSPPVPPDRDRYISEIQDLVNSMPAVFSHTPEEYYDCVSRWAARTEEGVEPPSLQLLRETGLDARMVHETACTIRQLNLDRAMSMHIWAAEAGHSPAIVTTMMLCINRPRLLQYSRIRAIETRFNTLVAQADNPDALAVAGFRRRKANDPKAAVRLLQRALAASKSAHFSLEEQARTALAKEYVSLGDEDAAVAVLEPIGADSGTGDREAVLGDILRSRDPEKAAPLLYYAACKGQRSLFAQLGDMELDKAEKASDEETRGEHMRWAEEWMRLSDERLVN